MTSGTGAESTTSSIEPTAWPRLTIGRLMGLIGLIGLGFGLARWSLSLVCVYFTVVLGVPVVFASDGGRSSRFSRPARKAGYAYLAGVVAPVLCLIFDPIVFRADGVPGMLVSVRPFCYTFMGIQMVVLALWLGARQALKSVHGLVSGMLISGAVFAGGLGLVLLPLSLIGLMFVIGVFGLTPFLTAHVYAVQGGLAATWMGRERYSRTVLGQQAVGALVALGPPALVQAYHDGLLG